MNKNSNFEKYKKELLEMYKEEGENVVNITLLENEKYRVEYLDCNNNLDYFDHYKGHLDFCLGLYKGEIKLHPNVPRYGNSPQPIS